MTGLINIQKDGQQADPDNNVTVYIKKPPGKMPYREVVVTKNANVISTLTIHSSNEDAYEKGGEEAVRHGFANEIYVIDA